MTKQTVPTDATSHHEHVGAKSEVRLRSYEGLKLIDEKGN
jgi:hypothetical protein